MPDSSQPTPPRHQPAPDSFLNSATPTDGLPAANTLPALATPASVSRTANSDLFISSLPLDSTSTDSPAQQDNPEGWARDCGSWRYGSDPHRVHHRNDWPHSSKAAVCAPCTVRRPSADLDHRGAVNWRTFRLGPPATQRPNG